MNLYFKIFGVVIIGVLFSFSGCRNDNYVTGVEIFPSVCVVKVSETQQLKAIVTPDNADDKTVRWVIRTIESKDSSDVASISENGRVTGLSEGFAAAICVTNNMFYEAKANIMVGYATAVKGMYGGSLSKDGVVINTTSKIGISYMPTEYEATEYEATFGLPFLDFIPWCPITVDYRSERMEFSGDTIVNVNEVMTPVKVSGTVTLYGMGEFEILVGDNPTTKYSFMGKNEKH